MVYSKAIEDDLLPVSKVDVNRPRARCTLKHFKTWVTPSVSQLWCHLAVSLLLMLWLTSFMAAEGFASGSCLAACFAAVSSSRDVTMAKYP